MPKFLGTLIDDTSFIATLSDVNTFLLCWLEARIPVVHFADTPYRSVKAEEVARPGQMMPVALSDLFVPRKPLRPDSSAPVSSEDSAFS